MHSKMCMLSKSNVFRPHQTNCTKDTLYKGLKVFGTHVELNSCNVNESHFLQTDETAEQEEIKQSLEELSRLCSFFSSDSKNKLKVSALNVSHCLDFMKT